MGKLLPSYKKAIFDEMLDNIQSNTSHYYAIASNPIPYETVNAPEFTDDIYSKDYVIWSMIFGKRLSNNDVIPVIEKNMWQHSTVYDRYDNTSNTLFANNNYYVVCQPNIVGGNYNIYKCIDNANGAVSTVNPSSVGNPTSATSFTTFPDGYRWRFITSVSSKNYDKFATNEYIPAPDTNSIKATAMNYSGVEVVVIANGGFGYDAYHDGILESVINSTFLQISANASPTPDFYVNNSIYLYNTGETTSQLKTITSYTANSRGRFLTVDSAVNQDIINEGITQYKISPRISFNTDGTNPKAYCNVNPFNNSISRIVMLDIGSEITRANVSVISNQGSGANLYAIVPPPGGHGSSAATELNMKGFGVSFSFSNSEISTIPVNVQYNKIGLIKNPFEIDEFGDKGERYFANTFSQALKGQVEPDHTFVYGTQVKGSSSGAKGFVSFSNGTHVHIVGDKSFEEGEDLLNTGGSYITTLLVIDSIGTVYSKDLTPLYVQNINNLQRANNQTESFKLIVQI